MHIVLCPDDIARASTSRWRAVGYVYGWTAPLVCVAGVLPFEERQEAQAALEGCARLEHLARVADLCGEPPVLLGRYNGEDAQRRPDLAFFEHRFSGYTLVDYRRPNLGKLEIHTLHSDIHTLVQVPNHLQDDAAALSPTDDRTASLRAHDFTRPRRRGETAFDQRVINQINYGQLFEQAITNTAPKALFPLRHGVTHVGSAFARLATYIRTSTSGQPHRFPRAVFELLRQHSALCQQVSIRLHQVLSLPGTFPTQTYDAGIVSMKATAEYMAYYNCVWLILNDIIIGWAFGTFLRENAQPMARMAGSWIRKLLVDDLQWTLLWLNSWPAGLKLNTELSAFLCHWLLGAVVAWNGALDALILPHLQGILWICGCMGCCGATITVAGLADLLALLTAHVHVCYVALRAVYAMQLSVLGSLWNLFRGKRYNVLRKRVDSWAYDVDQLLFGTILFTLLAFLFPTTLTYYAVFALVRLALLLAYALSDMLLVLINEFPLFALLLRAKDPFRLPGGVAFVLGKEGSSSHLQSQTISLGSVFSHYGMFWSAFSQHYHPANLLRRLVTSARLSHLTIHRSRNTA